MLVPKPLMLHQDYDREEVHNIFEPDTTFVSQRGHWGIWGLIELQDRPGDYVFLVTFGRREGEHEFDEGISTEGLLRWQSQPKQGFADQHIRNLITHDADRNTIHLFLRTANRRMGAPVPYTYLGRLAYDGHDRDRERPVHFRWRLLDWPIPDAVRLRIGLHLEDEFAGSVTVEPTGTLLEEPPPLAVGRPGEGTGQFRASRRRPSEAVAREISLAGELLVLAREMAVLNAAGRTDLAERVVHTSIVEGDHAGYDIRSFFSDGRTKHVEVKTTPWAQRHPLPDQRQ